MLGQSCICSVGIVEESCAGILRRANGRHVLSRTFEGIFGAGDGGLLVLPRRHVLQVFGVCCGPERSNGSWYAMVAARVVHWWSLTDEIDHVRLVVIPPPRLARLESINASAASRPLWSRPVKGDVASSERPRVGRRRYAIRTDWMGG